jgi:hypothetical protein
VVLCLSVSGGSLRPRQPSSGPEPEALLALSVGGEGRLSGVLRAPPARPAAPVVQQPLAFAACSTLHARTRVHASLTRARRPIVCTHLSRRPSAAPPGLQALLYQSLQQQAHRVYISPPPQPQRRRLPITQAAQGQPPPSWPCPAARAGGLPAPARAGSPWVWAPPCPPWQGLRPAGVGWVGRPQAWAPAGAGWQEVGGRGRVGLREKWLCFSYTPLHNLRVRLTPWQPMV